MAGEPIEQVKNGVQTLVSGLRQDPYALETAYLSVITFSASVQELVPLTELTQFQAPALSAGGGTSLGAGLTLLTECVRRDVHKASATHKGDWRPMVFVMTDGKPTDDWRAGLARFQQEKWGVVVACAIDGGDTGVLAEIAGKGAVVQLNTSDSAAMSAFFKWVTASVSVSSKSTETGGREVSGLSELPPPPPEIKLVF